MEEEYIVLWDDMIILISFKTLCTARMSSFTELFQDNDQSGAQTRGLRELITALPHAWCPVDTLKPGRCALARVIEY